MGTLINFISQHIHIPLSPSARERNSDYFVQHHQPCNKQHFYPIVVDDSRERALQQFPCEEKHSFNPHYQHNLISTSPSFSSPPSLSSSPSSSPSSAYSSSSNSSFSRATGHTISSGSSKHEYSYNRRYLRRQNLKCYTYQQQQEHYHDDWMFGITDDDDYSVADSEASMTQVSPVESPVSPVSSSAVSLKSSLSRKNKSQRGSVMSVFATASRSTVTFSPVVLEHPARKAQPSGLLPSISESSLSSLASDNSSAVATVSTSPAQSSSTGSQTAQQSLMRIAQCTKSEDGWCSQQAGQHIKRYAEATTRSMVVDGRRSRRL
ncbi:hypothetical protein B0O80DRAFT_453935 [Mortierella sp. GBAus27b]|nr:hypothetical protein BGX31_008866 [Mortierella sp. GBA43]KAI8352786.1 hypothetical protein B0O80DRAFT_453935 [Mortierella sp. GBAus27b]